MSSTKNTKPFCKVCFDAGKSEIDYRSHYLRSEPGPKGKIICPTLLSNECTYCHKKGHMKSHCLLLKKANKENAKACIRKAFENEHEVVNEKAKPVNKYSALDSDVEEEEEEEPKWKEEYPALCKASKSDTSKSYAEIVTKAQEMPKVMPKEIPKEMPKEVEVVAPEAEASMVTNKKPRIQMRSWADWTDSEDDDEDD